MRPAPVSARCAAWILAAISVAACPPAAAEPLVAGWIERVRIDPGQIVVQAKLDTGADTSSLDARDVKLHRRGGVDLVSFEVAGPQGTVRIERPMVRVARVRSALGTHERPVVTLGVCLGTVYRETEVTLVDRRSMKERMLVGRSFLRGRAMVDSGRTHLLEPSCEGMPAP